MDHTHMTDGQLAGTFAADRADDSAFQELVRRHGAMVVRTCRRITGNPQDGEDAAQLVFATLAAHAEKLASCRSLAGWLYSTAWHTSRRTRRGRDLKRRHEYHAVRLGPTDFNGVVDEETLAELYRAIEMLPPEYCEAIVLHHLQGLTVKQVSELMACAPGTTAARLSRGRAMMRDRLALRGLILSGAALESALLAEAAREVELAKVVARVPLDAESAAAISHAGGVADGVGLSKGKAIAALATIAPRKWLYAAAAAAVLGIGTVQASPVIFRTARTVYRTHISASGSASAETTSAGMIATTPVESSSGASINTVPEPGSLSVLALAGLALRRSRRDPGLRSAQTPA